MTRRIIVFLDIDGVLLPFPNKFNIMKGRIFPDETMSALSLILKAFPSTKKDSSSAINHNEFVATDVDIVLSSTWRVQKSIRDEIIADFHSYSYDGPLSTVDGFYDITDPSFHGIRQHEIYQWLQTQETRSSAWIALDDEDLMLGVENAKYNSYFEGHVIHCDSTVGLTRENAMNAIRLLRKQLDPDVYR
jgi:HAD domain in Swiss Army Knife RNA repair proteins